MNSPSPRAGGRFPRGSGKVPDLKTLEYSAICGVARALDIVTKSRSKCYYRPDDGSINYGWVLGNVEGLKRPIPCKGALGLWDLPTGILRAIKRQLPRVKLDE